MNLVTKGLGAFAALLPLVAAPVVAGAAVPDCPAGQKCLVGVPLDTPAEVLIVHPINGWVQQITGYPPPRPGFLCDEPGNTCANIEWPFPSIPDGVTAFDAAIRGSSGEVIVFAYSQGTQIAQQWLTWHLLDPTIPDPENLSFVLLGNSTRAYGGSLNFLGAIGDVWPPSAYPVVDVARQYEFSADYPNNPLSPFYQLALVNAIAGGWYLHDYAPVATPEAINSPANTVWKVGQTTYVLIPTENLPLLEPLRAFGLTALADSLNESLKPLVDSAYNRNYPNILQPGTVLDPPAADSTALAAVEQVHNLEARTVTLTTDAEKPQLNAEKVASANDLPSVDPDADQKLEEPGSGAGTSTDATNSGKPAGPKHRKLDDKVNPRVPEKTEESTEGDATPDNTATTGRDADKDTKAGDVNKAGDNNEGGDGGEAGSGNDGP